MWPIVLIIAGLSAFVLMVGGGLVWLAVRMPGPNVQSIVYPNKALVAYEVERWLQAIDQITDEINLEVLPLVPVLQDEIHALPDTIKSSTAADRLTQYAQKLKAAAQQVLVLYQKYQNWIS